MRIVRTLGVIGIVASVVVSVLAAPAVARGRVDAPWVVAASPTSMTLDWAGTGSYRLTARPQAGGRATSVRTRTSTGTVKGLRAGRSYCFTVARPHRTEHSRTYCHSTPRPVDAPATTSIRVATFNVCASVCRGWKERRDAIVRRIEESDADVVAVQELTRHGFALTSQMIRRGYVQVAQTSNDIVLVRTSGPGAHLRHHGDTEDGVVRAAGAASPWITMYDTVTGSPYTFISVHLESGTSRSASRARQRQAVALIRGMAASAARGPVVYAGDVNSSPARGGDPVGRIFARAGLVDAYQQSTSFTRAWVSSFNGFASRPRREVRYGDHIDRIFVPSGTAVSDWEVVAPLRHGRAVRPMASDHHPVRATLRLP
ncbi:endonuclease/exonuclease/phosphatase family protein [Aeromicrobium sp. CFBP 8757]|uniref:endonuclease/exonuclease/phosphatase family protein n=1 Tax=Aeromicrobium sp. CFBP 8757 TaxID=2775288 RepID=UPI0017834E91|nr:endonuclease/exonuclease/phosphatase family protein [Aeromicrobium sp. CFBP 8757]